MTGVPQPQSSEPGFVPRHASEEEYREFLSGYSKGNRKTVRGHLQKRRHFADAYPDLEDWFAAPLAERIGLVPDGEDGWTRIRRGPGAGKPYYLMRPYLYFLVLRGYLKLDLGWLIAARHLNVWRYLKHNGVYARIEKLVEEALDLGYAWNAAHSSLWWTLSRLYLHTGDASLQSIGRGEIERFEEALRSFSGCPEKEPFYGSQEEYRAAEKEHLGQLYLLGVVLYHRGQTSVLPRSTRSKPAARPALGKPRMETAAERYVAARSVDVRPKTAREIERGLRSFIRWASETCPEVGSFAEVDREMVLKYMEMLAQTPSAMTGRPLSPTSRSRMLGSLSAFFRDTAEWGWTDVPGRPLLSPGDYPEGVRRVPRYIPEAELSRLMEAIRSLECPYQRAALLVARWSGARRDEIRRLEYDCLGSYPDGTPRLRIPAGKTGRERVVPLSEEAAEAIRELQAVSKPGRGMPDPVTGEVTRYLFTNYGRPFSRHYLFEAPLERICTGLGLLTPDGKREITAHRFRHTLGTQLAERGANLHTIMSILGHESPQMSMVYARISDATVKRDYEAVLGPGAVLAGPSAEALRSGELSEDTVEWLKTNFFKTELELGHCLRLPQEGPCECDLYLTCAKFVTTKEYAPRLRARREREFELIEDAACNGWDREVERHRCTVRRIGQLLEDLGEPLAEDGKAG